MRICSLLPSATEIVYTLGLGDQIVAVTHECDFPPEAKSKPVITASALAGKDLTPAETHERVRTQLHKGVGLYHLDEGVLQKVKPDLILTQELCEVCAVAYSQVVNTVKIMEGEATIVSLEPNTLEDILDTIVQVGCLTGVEEKARQVVRGLRERIEAVTSITEKVAYKPRVFSMEWLDPPFIGGHWIPGIVEMAGGTEGLGNPGKPSHTVTWHEIEHYAPEIVILMPCGYGVGGILKEMERTTFPSEWYRLPAVRNGEVYAVDGSSYFSRPGPRVIDGLEILAQIIHPELFPRTASATMLQKLPIE